MGATPPALKPNTSVKTPQCPQKARSASFLLRSGRDLGGYIDMNQTTRVAALALGLGLSACGGSNPAPTPAAPVITTQPGSQVVLIGQTGSFDVVATGTGALTYQWQKDGVAIVGATAAAYTTPEVFEDSDNTRYKVVVSDTYSQSVTSVSAKLRIEGFIGTGTMTRARQRQAASKLASGKVLVSGGFSGAVLASAELYDPTTATFAATGSMVNARQNHTSTLLATGKVLLVGGEGGAGGGTPVATAELYDPTTGTFSVTGPMATARTLHTATILPNGKVLVTGGLWTHRADAILDTAEVYDPATGTFLAAGRMTDARYQQTATLLDTGKVLVAGGHGLYVVALSSADLYDPGTGLFTATGGLITPRYGQSATLLAASGQVLVAGGYGTTFLASAELYDPTAGTFALTGSMESPRYFQTATALVGGKVLLAGGYGADQTEPLSSAELFDPDLALFEGTASMEVGRNADTATLLDSGEVLVAGGWSIGDFGLASAELFSGAAP
jgi:hypothetical protein